MRFKVINFHVNINNRGIIVLEVIKMKSKKMLLNDGNEIPMLGFGVFMIYDEKTCIKSIDEALKDGYRHIDTAEMYKNERFVGEAIKKSGINRKDIFITTKIWPSDYGYEKTKEALDKSLKKLDTDYIDLVLLHKPYGNYIEAWKYLEKAKDKELVKSIGVSNFDIDDIDNLLKHSNIKPTVDQIECHPYSSQNKMKAYLDKKDIKLEAWYPLGHGSKKLMNEPILKNLAFKYDKTVPEIILRWHIQRGNIIIPKSTNPKHIEDNIKIFDFNLMDEDMKKIDSLNKDKPFYNMPRWLDKIISKVSDKLPLGDKN